MICVILYRTPNGVFAITDDEIDGAIQVHEFASRDAAVAYAEEGFSADIPVQVVELDEL